MVTQLAMGSSKISHQNNATNFFDLQEFSLDELSHFRGTGPDKRIYVALRGRVFDVSKSYDQYRPDTAYSRFAGKDATRGFVMFEAVPSDAPIDTDDLTAQQKESLDNWEKYYMSNYPLVGRLKSK